MSQYVLGVTAAVIGLTIGYYIGMQVAPDYPERVSYTSLQQIRGMLIEHTRNKQELLIRARPSYLDTPIPLARVRYDENTLWFEHGDSGIIPSTTDTPSVNRTIVVAITLSGKDSYYAHYVILEPPL